MENRNVTFSLKHDEHADVDGDDNNDRHRHVDVEQWIQRKENKKELLGIFYGENVALHFPIKKMPS